MGGVVCDLGHGSVKRDVVLAVGAPSNGLLVGFISLISEIGCIRCLFWRIMLEFLIWVVRSSPLILLGKLVRWTNSPKSSCSSFLLHIFQNIISFSIKEACPIKWKVFDTCAGILSQASCP